MKFNIQPTDVPPRTDWVSWSQCQTFQRLKTSSITCARLLLFTHQASFSWVVPSTGSSPVRPEFRLPHQQVRAASDGRVQLLTLPYSAVYHAANAQAAISIAIAAE